MRSAVETKFSNINSKFKRFKPRNNNRYGDIRIYNLQYKFCWMLLNFFNLESNYNIKPTKDCESWFIHKFEFPNENAEESNFCENVREEKRKIEEMTKSQVNYLGNLISLIKKKKLKKVKT